MRPADYVVLVALSLSLAACGVFGASYVLGEGYPVLQLWAECLLTVLFGVLAMIVLTLFSVAFDSALLRARANALGAPASRTRRLFERLTPAWSVSHVAAFAAVMALLWLPYYIANFPGSTYWDTYYQIYQVYPENHPIAIIPWAEMYGRTLTDAWLVDHHPVFTTLLYGAFGWVSDQLTGNWMAGVALFCVLQGIAHVVAFTVAVAYLRKVGCPPALCFAAYTFFALAPFVSTWAMCMVKDSLFGLVFVGYVMMLFECVRTRGAVFLRQWNVVLFVLCGLGLCLTKKTGLFVVVATAAVALALHWRRCRSADAVQGARAAIKAYLAQALTCLLALCLVLPYILFPMLNIAPGGKQEALGPLLQQTARYVCDYGSEVTPQERAAISRVVDYSRLDDQYRFDFQDSVKYRYNLDATTEDIVAYLKVYVAQGLKHPDAYFAATVSLAGFYIAPTAPINIRMVTVDTKMGDEQRYMLWNPDGLVEDLRLGIDGAYEAISEIPVLNAPLLIVVYVLWIPAFLLYSLWRHRVGRGLAGDGVAGVAECGLLLVPFAVLLGFCVIAPVYDARYVVPILDGVPLLFCAVFTYIMNSFQDDSESCFEQGGQPGSQRSLEEPADSGQVSSVQAAAVRFYEGRGPDGNR